MGHVIVGTTMSLDGFINDRSGSVASLYPNLEELPLPGEHSPRRVFNA